MTYEVLAQDLTAAAGEFRSMTSPLSGYELTLTNMEPESLGHIELAAWLVAVDEQCDNAGRALRAGAEDLGNALDSSASYYTQADETASSEFDFLQPPGVGPFASPLGGPTP